jgi:hypothetical protein
MSEPKKLKRSFEMTDVVDEVPPPPWCLDEMGIVGGLREVKDRRTMEAAIKLWLSKRTDERQH